VNVDRSICSEARQSRLAVPMSLVTTLKLRACGWRMRRSNALPCDWLRYRYFGSGVRLNGFSENP
jgi:hypothetical protein